MKAWRKTRESSESRESEDSCGAPYPEIYQRLGNHGVSVDSRTVQVEMYSLPCSEKSILERTPGGSNSSRGSLVAQEPLCRIIGNDGCRCEGTIRPASWLTWLGPVLSLFGVTGTDGKTSVHWFMAHGWDPSPLDWYPRPCSGR